MSYGVCVHFSLPHSCLLCTGILSAHVWSMALMSGGAFLKRMEFQAFRLINSPPLTDCLDFLIYRRNVVSLSSTAIFMSTALLNLLTAFIPPCRGLATQDFLLLLIPILTIYLMQELTRIFTLLSLILVNSGTLFHCVFRSA